ncbi:MAG TPA: hypothetical protein VKF36_18865 [Syntrophorhabdales bacterium]|nr:hypothetical protein [Syntrophorhabdales bacterium]
MTDLQRLIEKYRKELTQLEAQIVEVKREHDVLVEASRLLKDNRGTNAAHAALSFAKYAALLVCVSLLWLQFHGFTQLIVPIEVRPTDPQRVVRATDPQQVDRVKQSLLKVGAPTEKIDELATAVKGASATAGVNPILLVALMYTENETFDYKAVSEKGYKGLMQTPWASMRWADVDILLGAKILQEKLKLSENNLLEALRLYKGGKNTTATRQAKRTIEVYEDLLKEKNTQ